MMSTTKFDKKSLQEQIFELPSES